jgi:transposase
MTNSRQNSMEMEHHKQAFELYYGSGLKRTYKAVAARFGVSVSTIKNWSRAFRWQERITERESEATHQITDQVAQQRTEFLEQLIKFIQIASRLTMKNVAEGKVKSSVKDLATLVDLHQKVSTLLGLETDPDAGPRYGTVIFDLGDNGHGPGSATREFSDSERRELNGVGSSVRLEGDEDRN